MRILALEPFHGGSHAAFLDGWGRHSSHDITPLTLSAHHWKWRMRHAAVTLAERAGALDGPFNALWASDMLDLAAFRGLAPAHLAALPAVLYFHENQLAYPTTDDRPRDTHFGFTNFISALAAIASGGEVWWNSAYNRDRFLAELRTLLSHTPKPRMATHVPRIEAHSRVMHPGIDPVGGDTTPRRAGDPLHLLWAARWEHDKNPALFFTALDRLVDRGVTFRVSVIGESYAQTPAAFAQARARLGDRVARWGYQATRADYEAALRDADVVVSTADHEFFGLSVVEAASAGCVPVLPRALAYPELFDESAVFYPPGDAEALADALVALADGGALHTAPDVSRFAWPTRAAAMDQAITSATSNR